jgi:hypothetical protein
LRLPVAQDAPELTPDAKVLRRLRRPWRCFRFSDREIAREQVETAKQFRRIAPRRGAEW